VSDSHPRLVHRLLDEAVAAADRRRRSRTASSRAWQAAPFVAAAGLVVAAAGRWAGWSPLPSLTVVAVALLSLFAYVAYSRRRRPVSDAIASAIDNDAGLGGELRSASWFTASGARDPWTELHVERAADRVSRVDWPRLYPPVRATRARAATSILVFATIALTILFPDRWIGGQNAAGASATSLQLKPGAAGDSDIPALLSPELQKELEALLAAAEAGTLTLDQKSAQSGELKDLLAKLRQLVDRDALKDLAHAMDQDRIAGTKRTAEEMKNLAERAKRAAEMGANSREFREAMEEFARNLSEAAYAEQSREEEALASISSSKNPEAGDTGQTNAAPGMDEASIQSVRDAEPGGASGVMMMSSQDSPSGAAPPGFGIGGSGTMNSEGQPTDLPHALRRETVEADKDNAGDNVEAQIRRKTEEGQATATFTRGASAKSDVNRAAPPPAVPEARRTDVQRYFIRKQ
jgi:hypothetical protein